MDRTRRQIGRAQEGSSIVPEKRTLRVIDLVTDVREGLTDAEMIEKYKLTPRGLKSAFQKLLDSKALTPFEFSQWSSLFNTSQDLNDIRLFTRDTLTFHLPVYDMEPPRTKGRVVNVSESGIAIAGIAAEVDEKKTFLIPIKGDPVVLEATCKWTRETLEPENFCAGFDITRVPRGDWEKLEKQIGDVVVKAHAPKQPLPQAEPVAPAAALLHAVAEPEPLLSDESRLATPEPQPAPYEEELPPPRAPEQAPPVTPPPPSQAEEEPSLELVRQYLESREYAHLFTASRNFLAYIMNPVSFATLSTHAREEMLARVREKNGVMITDLRKKARAFQLAVENSALLGEL
jgi:hypothetical protein